MSPKELVDHGICVSMAEGRRLSRQMERNPKCRDKVLKSIKENGPVAEKADALDSKPSVPRDV